MKLQEHEYKARDKTVHKMSRDGLREENLHNKEEKRITSRDEDIEVSRNPKKFIHKRFFMGILLHKQLEASRSLGKQKQ